MYTRKAQNSARPVGKALDDATQARAALQGRVGHSEGRFQTDDAEGGLAEFEHLVFAVLRPVVAHNGVDGAILHAFAQGFDVLAVA